MRSTYRRGAKYATALLMLLASFNSTIWAQQQNGDNSIASMERNADDQTPTNIVIAPAAKLRDDNSSELFVRYLGMKAPDNKMVHMHTNNLKKGIKVQRFYQQYKGLKVDFGNYTVTSKDGFVSYLSGNYYNINYPVSVTPTLTERTAFTKATKFVGATRYMWQSPKALARLRKATNKPDTTYMPKGVLVLVQDFKDPEAGRKVHLAYSFDIYAEQPLSRQVVYVDAKTGKILFSNQLLQHTAATGRSRYSGIVPFQTANTGGTYIMYDSTRGNGIYTMNCNNDTATAAITDFSSVTNTWPSAPLDTVGIDAHWGAEQVYDYWLNEQGRRSWDDLDGILLQYVHYDTSFDNAFWSGSEMVYGDGSGASSGGMDPLVGFDVVAHEIAHGVCQATAALIYEKEPGAINEGFSDCWAATIENWANPFETDAVAKNIWYIGEEIRPGVPLRRMDFPKLRGQPDTHGGINWYPVTSCTPTSSNDHCGVHRNSGVMNKWYYLLSVGGAGTNDNSNAYSVAGIGLTSASYILYLTELTISSTTTYAQLRTASINAAITLFGPCSPEVVSVTNAWYAVGVGAAAVLCTPQIGFVYSVMQGSEKVAGSACPASDVTMIGVRPMGAMFSGGNPVVNLVTFGTAVAGVDYTLTGGTMTFPVGDTTTQYAMLTTFDNGAVNDDRTINITFTLSAMGSDAIRSPSRDTLQINVLNDDIIPAVGAQNYRTLNTGGSSGTSTFSSPFAGSGVRARNSHLLFASELTAAGVVPGMPITQLGYNVVTKNSTGAFNGLTVKMANTTVTDVTGGFVPGMVQVYNGNYTTFVGLDTIDFNSGSFTWDGTSNVAIEVCFTNATAIGSANDVVSARVFGSTFRSVYNTTSSVGGTGCSLSPSSLLTDRPVVRFKQRINPAQIETTLGGNRTWDVHTGQEVYFYSTPGDTEVIAGLNGISHNLGCVNGTLSQAGTGFVPATFSTIDRSRKEVTLTPTINGAITTHDMTMYMTTAEMAGISPSTLLLLRTTAPTDATVSSSNSIVVTPTIITGENYVAFRGTFTGVGRYFLVNGPLCTAPPATVTPSGATTFCSGSSVTLNASTGGGYTYQWQLGASDISGATNSSYVAATGGNYTVRVTSGGCAATSTTTTVTVNTTPTATITPAGPTTFCSGGSVVLNTTTGAGLSYQWHVGGSPISGATNASYTATTGGSHTVVVSNVAGCNATSSATAITVPASPVAVITPAGPTTFCSGSSVVLNATTGAGYSYQWRLGGSPITGATTAAYTATAGGNYDVVVTVASCSATSAVTTITVTSGVTATVTPAGSTSFCTGGSVVLNSSTGTGYTYQWLSGTTAITGATNASYTASTTAGYSVLVRNPSGCSDTSSVVTVTASTLPSAVITPAGPTTFCTGGSVVLSVPSGAGYTYQWSRSGSPISGATTSSHTANVAGNYTVIVNNSGCIALSSSTTITITPGPGASITPAGPTTFCTGGSVVLNATSGSGITYQWLAGGTPISGATTGAYTATTSGSYQVIVTSGSCVVTSPATVVTVTGAIAAPITGGSSFCIGQATTLSNANAGGTWTSSNPAVATIGGSSGVLTGVSAGTARITYIVTTACGTTTSTLTVTVSAAPVVASTSGTFSICTGATTTLSNTTSSGVWSSSNTAVATINASGIVSSVAVGTTTISYTVTNSSGCATSATNVLAVATPPVVTINPASSTSFCTGGFVMLNATLISGATYQWYRGGVAISGALSSGYLASTSGNYTVEVNSGSGCISTSAAVTVTVSSSVIVVPSVSVSASPGTTLCLVTSPVTFTPTATNGGTSPTYQWYVNGTPMTTGPSFTYSPADADVVRCRLNSNATCAFPDSAATNTTMTISPAMTPSVTVATSPGNMVCIGTFVRYTATPAFGGSAPTYAWSKNGINVGTGTTYGVIPNDGDIIRCTMISNFSCLTTTVATSTPVIMDIVPPSVNTVTVFATKTAIVAGQIDTFVAVAPNGGTSPVYQWYINGIPVTGATGSLYITDSLKHGQIVQCAVTSSDNCTSPRTGLSNGVSVTVTTGLQAAGNAMGNLTLAPNPNKGSFVVKGALAGSGLATLQVTNILGQTVYAAQLTVTNGAINEQIQLPEQLASGTYLVKITHAGVPAIFHIVVDK